MFKAGSSASWIIQSLDSGASLRIKVWTSLHPPANKASRQCVESAKENGKKVLAIQHDKKCLQFKKKMCRSRMTRVGGSIETFKAIQFLRTSFLQQPFIGRETRSNSSSWSSSLDWNSSHYQTRFLVHWYRFSSKLLVSGGALSGVWPVQRFGIPCLTMFGNQPWNSNSFQQKARKPEWDWITAALASRPELIMRR